MENEPKMRIVIEKDGPYVVCGGVPLEERIIVPEGHGVKYEKGKSFPLRQQYSLCRCGKSSTMPFCDGHHQHGFDGTETANCKPYFERARMMEGPDLVLADVIFLCAFARFCHGEHGDTWTLTMHSDDPALREEAIKTACDCPAGRLVAIDKKTGKPIEPELEPGIVILQDPSRDCSGPFWVKGGIPIESSEGFTWEVRNRVTLCRCGESENKPFCDAMHVSVNFKD